MATDSIASRNNNPFNIRSGEDWQGLSAQQDDSGFAKFDDPVMGVRAGAKLFNTYADKYNINTIEKLLNRFAPSTENDTQNYIKNVVEQSGYKADEPIDLKDPQVQSKLLPIIARMESNDTSLTPEQYQKGIELARSSTPSTRTKPYKQTSIANFNNHIANNKSKNNAYSETTSFVANTPAVNEILKGRFNNIHEEPVSERAQAGAKLGAGIGLAKGGLWGGIIGATIGGFAGRALGQIKTGEYNKQRQLDSSIKTLNTIGIAKNNAITFSDGSEFVIDPNIRLANTDTVFSKNKTRSIYEIDVTNPFTNRTKPLAKTLAYLTASYDKNGGSIEELTAMYTNSLQAGADSIDTIKLKAKELAKKLGIPKSKAIEYFSASKAQLKDEELGVIIEGLDTIYG